MQLSLQTVASIVDTTVNQPKPIRKMDNDTLTKEIDNLTQMRLVAILANRTRFEEIFKLRASATTYDMWINGIKPDMTGYPEHTLEHDYIVSRALLDKLQIRINACNTEQANRRRSRNSTPRTARAA